MLRQIQILSSSPSQRVARIYAPKKMRLQHILVSKRVEASIMALLCWTIAVLTG
jgi:hypothetical protein